jgi:hypothetical protein
MCLHYGYDKESWALVEQYLVGTELLAAPVLYEGATSSEVYFPFFSGSWVHIVSQPVFFYSIFFYGCVVWHFSVLLLRDGCICLVCLTRYVGNFFCFLCVCL